jgi:RNA polymerase sigma factor (TIGR02999 family)
MASPHFAAVVQHAFASHAGLPPHGFYSVNSEPARNGSPAPGNPRTQPMNPASDATVTRLLSRLDAGDTGALDELVPLVYEELRAIAHRHRVQWRGHETLCTTALVNEAYLKLVGQNRISLNDRAHFFALAGKAMRHILSNYAESRQRLKRGGGASPVTLAGSEVAEPESGGEEDAAALEALTAALQRLERTNARLANVVDCRFFAGMTIEETAMALGTSPATVKRDWLLARALLSRELAPHHAQDRRHG